MLLRTAAVLLAPGFEEAEAALPIDVLRRAGVEVAVLAVGPELAVRGAHALSFLADGPLEGYAATPDVTVLPGGMPGARNLADSAAVRALCGRTRDNGGWIAALCASPAVVLGPWGYLKGKRVTCYPSFRDQLPADSMPVDAPVVKDDPLITGRGPGAAAAFALAMVEELCGDTRADEIRRAMGIAC